LQTHCWNPLALVPPGVLLLAHSSPLFSPPAVGIIPCESTILLAVACNCRRISLCVPGTLEPHRPAVRLGASAAKPSAPLPVTCPVLSAAVPPLCAHLCGSQVNPERRPPACSPASWGRPRVEWPTGCSLRQPTVYVRLRLPANPLAARRRPNWRPRARAMDAAQHLICTARRTPTGGAPRLADPTLALPMLGRLPVQRRGAQRLVGGGRLPAAAPRQRGAVGTGPLPAKP
jgi:hypothetical protein